MKIFLLTLKEYFYIWCVILKAKFHVRCLPYRVWSKRCGIFQAETLRMHCMDARQLKILGYRISRMSRFFPWKNVCLEQAFAAHLLLKKQTDHTLYFGMRKSDEGEWLAHAWVRCGDTWVVGYHPQQSYTVVGTFAFLSEISILGDS